MGSRQFSNELSNLGPGCQGQDGRRTGPGDVGLAPPVPRVKSNDAAQRAVVKKRARLAAIARVTLQKAGGPVVSPRPIVVTQPSVISTTTERLQARQLGTYPSVSFHGLVADCIHLLCAACGGQRFRYSSGSCLLASRPNALLFRTARSFSSRCWSKPALSVTQAPVIEMPVSSFTISSPTASPTTARPVLVTAATTETASAKPTAAKPASPALVTNKTASVNGEAVYCWADHKEVSATKDGGTPSPPAVVTPGIFVKSSVRTPLSPLPAATVTPKVVKGKPASTVSEKRKGKVNGTSSKRAPPTTVVPHLNTTSSTTADPSFYIVSPYPVTDAPVDLSTLSTPRLESHWPDLYVHHDGQVVDQGYPWNLEKESDHALYEEWSRWRYNETEGVVHELSGSFGENLMPKRWPKTLPSQTPRPVVTGSVVVVDSDVVAVSNEETVVSPPAEKVNIAAAPPNVNRFVVVLGKGGRPLFMREITSRRLDQVVDKEAAYDSGAEWDPEEDTDSVDEREEMPAKKVDAAALSEFQRMTSVAGHQERFEPHSARKLAAAEKASEQELKRLMRGTAV
ncbi:hypothetical protein TYRP_020150 [Tyrophagus putrescentiae]|nr:hypothetical protein TYRP_020150 [Tyrophagus putrescentiae]